MYAIVAIAGHQYKVTPGQIFTVDRMDVPEGELITIPQVLLFADGETISIGTPYVPGVVIKAKVLKHIKGDKIRVARFKAKVRYRKVRGFRAALTQILIEKIEVKKASPHKKAA